MTTAYATSGLAHSTNADFQAWTTELMGLLDTVGLTQTADTGQFTPASASIPATNATVYQIRYLNDSLHGTKPLYLKIECGTDATSGRPAIWVTAASATNGAGTLSGTTYFARAKITSNFTISAGSFWTGACVLPGFFFMAWKRGAQATAYGSTPLFAVCRTADASGTPTSAGFYFYATNSGRADRTTYISAATSDSVAYACSPGPAASTLISGAPQVFRHFGYQPDVACSPFALSFFTSEIGDLSTWQATPFGVTSRTYLALGGSYGPTHAGVAASSGTIVIEPSFRLALQWE